MILVDSTRAGKRIPDSLSKTVPIWCAVVNRALRRLYSDVNSSADWDTNLYTPPNAVSRQEHEQIQSRLDGWADSLVVSLLFQRRKLSLFDLHSFRPMPFRTSFVPFDQFGSRPSPLSLSSYLST